MTLIVDFTFVLRTLYVMHGFRRVDEHGGVSTCRRMALGPGEDGRQQDDRRSPTAGTTAPPASIALLLWEHTDRQGVLGTTVELPQA